MDNALLKVVENTAVDAAINTVVGVARNTNNADKTSAVAYGTAAVGRCARLVAERKTRVKSDKEPVQ
jgi:hypothetical protein